MGELYPGRQWHSNDTPVFTHRVVLTSQLCNLAEHSLPSVELQNIIRSSCNFKSECCRCGVLSLVGRRPCIREEFD